MEPKIRFLCDQKRSYLIRNFVITFYDSSNRSENHIFLTSCTYQKTFIRPYLRPRLMRHQKRKSKTENGIFFSIWIFRSEEKSYQGILCDRILMISDQHFSIYRFRSRPRTEMGGFSNREDSDRKYGAIRYQGVFMAHTQKPRLNTRDTT